MQHAVLNLCRVKLRDQQRLAHGPLAEYPNEQFTDEVPRSGNASGGGQPGWAVKCSPGGPNDYIYVIVQPPGWAPIAKLIGRPELAEDPEWATPEARLPKLDKMFQLIEEWSSRLDKWEVLAELNALNIPCGPILSTKELIEDASLADNNMVVTVDHPERGRVHDGRLPDQAVRLAGEGRDLAAARRAQRGRVRARAGPRPGALRRAEDERSDLIWHESVAYDKDAVREVLDKARAEGRDSLTAPEGRRVCEAYGIPTPGEGLASTADEAVQLAGELGGPVVMKIVSPDILHKTEAGGVKIGVSGDDAVRSAYDEIIANATAYNADATIDGIQVQQMLSGGQEVIIGATTDPTFGKVVVFGLGGVLVEVLKDVTFRLAPVDHARPRSRCSTTSRPPRCCAACAGPSRWTPRRSPTSSGGCPTWSPTSRRSASSTSTRSSPGPTARPPPTCGSCWRPRSPPSRSATPRRRSWRR